MKTLLRGILKFIRGLWENIVWGIVSLDVKAYKCGIKRRHITFGLLVLLISTLFTGLYIYQKNWFIEGKRKAGRSELQLTISLNGEESAVQEMSEEIRDSILETPMAAASASQAAAQSASNVNAARSNPDSASSQSASASGAQSPATASAAGSSSSFSPSVTTPNSSVMSGKARAENSQSMTQASPQSSAPSASAMSAARSNPQNSAAQSAAAQSATAPDSPAASGASSALAPSVSQAATSTVQSGQPRAESSQTMSAVSAQSMAESASTMSAARSAPSSANAQSASANSAASPTSISAAGASRPLSPSSPRAATSTVMTQRSARAAPSQTMAQASAQTMAQSAGGSSSARSTPSASSSASSASAASANTSGTATAANSSSAFSPQVSSARASSASVRSSQARAESGWDMSSASSQSLAQAATGSRGTARNSPSQSMVQASGSAQAANTASAVSGSGATGSFSPSASAARASASGVASSAARAEAGRSMSGASGQSMAQAATGSRGTSRNSPSQSSGQSTGSAQASNSASSVSGSGTSASFSPSVSGTSVSTSGVASNGARAEAGRSMSGASGQSMAQAATGSRGTSRNGPSQSSGQGIGSAQASNTASSISGSGTGRSFSPTGSGVTGIGTALGGSNNGARAVVGQRMAGASGQSMASAATGARGSARSGPSGTYGRGAAAGSARGMNQVAGISGTGSSRAFAPSVSGSRGSSRVVMNRPGSPAIEGHTPGTAPAAASGGGLTLGGGPTNTDQVMVQARASSVSQPVRFAGARRNPLRAYVSRPNESQPSAAPLRLAMTGNPGGRGSFSPTVTRTPQTIPTFEKVQLNPEAALVANNPGAELAELPPLANPYELRLSPKLRADFVQRQGGGPETEAAVALALEWLKRNQSKDGRWNHRSSHSTAATGAAMLAFLGWGTKHTEPGPYQQTLARAIDWMLSVEKNGDLRYRGNMYDHGIAAIAILEAYNLTKDERLRAPAERILAFTIKAQNPQTGGWRYKTYREDPSEKGDLSVSGWQMMALKSARLGGMNVPEASFEKARKFLDGVGVKDKGFQYRPGWKPSSAMIAEGLFCEQMLGAGVVNSKMKQCVSLIQNQLPSNNKVDYYYWYYGSLAMRQAQGQDWQNWNDKLKPILLRKQVLRGNNRGCWEPEGKNSKAAGRVVTTALAALSLEVYYRYLPLYSPEFSKAGE